MIRGLELSVPPYPPPQPLGKGEGLEVELKSQWLMIQSVSLCNEASIKPQKSRAGRTSGLVTHRGVRRPVC